MASLRAHSSHRRLNWRLTSRGALPSILTRLNALTDAELMAFFQNEYHLPFVDLAATDIPHDVIRLIPLSLAQRHQLLPTSLNGSTLTLAMADPSNFAAINEVEFLTGYDVKVTAAAPTVIAAALQRLSDRHIDYDDVLAHVSHHDVERLPCDGERQSKEIEPASEDAPVARLVNAILTTAVRRRASDCHLEPFEKFFRVRYRIDGLLEEIMKPPSKLKNAVTSRIKVMANLDIAERRLPQDGRIKLRTDGEQDMDVRVSVLPTIYGEKIALRLLDKTKLQLDIRTLGFEETSLRYLKDAIAKPFGMVLVTGPTGSGKTTTLYSALTELNRITSNISTAEDPVEFSLVGINQVQINEHVGLDFANVLRAFLRQDPDVIMIGEIRDVETAQIAIKAALTGHLVLTTVHTNDAPSTIVRLLNMGVEPFLVASSVNLVLSQRLARLICSDCRAPTKIPLEVLTELGVSPGEAPSLICYRGAGCAQCSGSGYRGRTTLYEVMPLSDELRKLILTAAPANEIKRMAVCAGMKSLRQGGLAKLKAGLTTVEEILRVTMAD